MLMAVGGLGRPCRPFAAGSVSTTPYVPGWLGWLAGARGVSERGHRYPRLIKRRCARACSLRLQGIHRKEPPALCGITNSLYIETYSAYTNCGLGRSRKCGRPANLVTSCAVRTPLSLGAGTPRTGPCGNGTSSRAIGTLRAIGRVLVSRAWPGRVGRFGAVASVRSNWIRPGGEGGRRETVRGAHTRPQPACYRHSI